MTTSTKEKQKRTQLRKRIFARLNQLGMDTRADLIWNFTCGRTSSLRELETWEMEELLTHLGGKKSTTNIDYQYAKFDNDNKQHLYLLSLCFQYGWVRWSEKRKKEVADLNRLGRWIRLYSRHKKPLKQLNNKELQTTIYQFEQMVQKHYSHD